MRLSFFVLLTMLFLAATAQNRDHAYQLNQKLGRGINWGNMLEAPSETAWGNPWKPEYARIAAQMGFNHTRIPVRWEPSDRSNPNPPYTIYPSFLNRVKQVVDSSLQNGMYAIINLHHHEALYEDPDGQKARFLSMWKQIAEFFAAYPDSLVFEILNEPHGNLSAEKWNVFLADALTTIRSTNPNRVVLVGLAEYGGLAGLKKLVLPDDENIILTVHYYNPFQFTHQGASWVGGADAWLGTKWNDTETERSAVINDFAPLKAYEQEHHIPIHIGEFGSYSTADAASRERWTTYIARYIESLGWSWAYWEFSAGFGVYNPETESYNQPIYRALFENQMPEPARLVGVSVYQSDFSQDASEWNLYVNGGAAAAKSLSNGQLTVQISSKGTQGWHVQLVKNGIALSAGKKYRLSFRAKAAVSRGGTAYVGESASPWAPYSGYNNFDLTTEFHDFAYVFDMTRDDNTARIVFDLGADAADVMIESVKLEQVELQFPTYTKMKKDLKSRLFPNPVQRKLWVDNRDGFRRIVLFSASGDCVFERSLQKDRNELSLDGLPSGIYFATLDGAENRQSVKIIKK